MPSAWSARSTVTKLSPALLAICSAWSSVRDNAGDSWGCEAPPPDTLGSLASAASVRCSACLALPPARVMRTGRHALGIVEQRLEQVLGR